MDNKDCVESRGPASLPSTARDLRNTPSRPGARHVDHRSAITELRESLVRIGRADIMLHFFHEDSLRKQKGKSVIMSADKAWALLLLGDNRMFDPGKYGRDPLPHRSGQGGHHGDWIQRPLLHMHVLKDCDGSSSSSHIIAR